MERKESGVKDIISRSELFSFQKSWTRLAQRMMGVETQDSDFKKCTQAPLVKESSAVLERQPSAVRNFYENPGQITERSFESEMLTKRKLARIKSKSVVCEVPPPGH